MADLQVRKVNSLPTSLLANTIYIVNSSATEAEMFVTNNSGAIVARKIGVVGNITEDRQSTLNLSSGFSQTVSAQYDSILTGSNTSNKLLRLIDRSLLRTWDTIIIRVLVRNVTTNNNKAGILRFWTTNVDDANFLEIRSLGTDPYSGVFEIHITNAGGSNYWIHGQVLAGQGFVSSDLNSFSRQISLTSNWRPRVDFLSGLEVSPNYGGDAQLQYYIDYKRADDYIFV